MGREDLDCSRRILAIEASIATIEGPVLIVAHSGGCIMVSHWANTSVHTNRVKGALLATPPDFERPMPEGYPSLVALKAGGWLLLEHGHNQGAAVRALLTNAGFANVQTRKDFGSNDRVTGGQKP